MSRSRGRPEKLLRYAKAVPDADTFYRSLQESNQKNLRSDFGVHPRDSAAESIPPNGVTLVACVVRVKR